MASILLSFEKSTQEVDWKLGSKLDLQLWIQKQSANVWTSDLVRTLRDNKLATNGKISQMFQWMEYALMQNYK